MIREANEHDIPELVALGRQMHGESPRWGVLTFDEARLETTLRSLIGSPMGFVWVAEDSAGEVIGGMVAVVCEHWCSADRVASDLALFMRMDCRGSIAPARLLRAYRAWAHEQGAKLVQVGVTTGVHADLTASMMERVGFRRCGVLLEA